MATGKFSDYLMYDHLAVFVYYYGTKMVVTLELSTQEYFLHL